MLYRTSNERDKPAAEDVHSERAVLIVHPDLQRDEIEIAPDRRGR